VPEDDDEFSYAPDPPERTFHCGVAGCQYTGVSAQAVGMHKFHVHGIRATRQTSHPKKRQIAANPNLGGEDIVLVVLASLFPNGIPVDKLRLVLDWSAATEQFVDKARG
jgi:hypothetical protein